MELIAFVVSVLISILIPVPIPMPRFQCQGLKMAHKIIKGTWCINSSSFTPPFTLKIIQECLSLNLKTKNFILCLNETLEMVYFTKELSY